MTKFVCDTAAARSLSAYVILKRGQFVTTVTAHFGYPRVIVNVGAHGDQMVQTASASGYGYDKFTHALSGLVIDGHKMRDHCAHDEASAKVMRAYGAAVRKALIAQDGDSPSGDNGNKRARAVREAFEAKVKRKGMRFANWRDSAYTSLFYEPGLDLLRALGYTVIQAI